MSGIRNIMHDIAAITAQPDVANLSIGNPAIIPEVTECWHALARDALAASFTGASCQYGSARGTARLIDAIADYFGGHYGWDIGPQNIVVGPGSQLLCFIAAALYSGAGPAGPGKLVLPMLPDYPGYQGLVMDSEAITGVEGVPEVAGDRNFRYTLDLPALRGLGDIGMLLLSSPGNPTGRAADAGELGELARLARQRDIPLLVDNAYGEPFPRISSTSTAPLWQPNVINCFTFSKAGLPGERIGFAIGPECYIDPMVAFIANSALHAPQLMQIAAAIALETGRLDELVAAVITPFYRDRRKQAEAMLLDLLPGTVNWRLHSGDGGMYCWIWVDHEWFDDMEFYRVMKRRGVFIVPGNHFFGQPSESVRSSAHGRRCFRISLSMEPNVLSTGIERIARVLGEFQNAIP